jgi:hypothetical protein
MAAARTGADFVIAGHFGRRTVAARATAGRSTMNDAGADEDYGHTWRQS